MGYAMFRSMRSRPSLFSLFCQLFLLFTFLCAPIADNMHAIRMSQTTHGDTQKTERIAVEKMSAMASMPCHETMMVPAEADATRHSGTGKSDPQKPCCPYKQCSPKNCLMHFAIASMPVLEIIPHSPIDSRTFLDTDIHLVSVPFTERLRPPIG